MKQFIQKYEKDLIGVLSGWDRILFRGTQRALANVAGMMSYLCYVGVLLREFGDYVEETSCRIKKACEETAEHLGRPVEYLASCHTSKEGTAKQIVQRDGISEGLVCLIKCVEPGMSYRIGKDPKAKKLVLVKKNRPCLHYYHYWMNKDFGLMHARLQTWFPFNIQVCLNGRLWLARQMDKHQLAYEQRENCFTRLEDVGASQELMNDLLTLNWPHFLQDIANQVNPLQKDILHGYRTDYYWSAYETEWATDLMFRSPRALAQIYSSLVCKAICTFSSKDVMRFLGKKPQGPFKGQIVSSYLRRPEGVRVKHRVKQNSVKMYDKQGSILRVETTINNPYDFSTFRPKEGDPEGSCQLRYLRKGISDLQRRSVISQDINNNYLEGLSCLETDTPLKELLLSPCKRKRVKGRSVRALRPWSVEDQKLILAISRGEYTVNGFSNRDMVEELYPKMLSKEVLHRRSANRVTRQFRLLRHHHIIRKMPGKHRYKVTKKGRQIATSTLCFQNITLQQLSRLSA
jgi:hypothetical protein